MPDVLRAPRVHGSIVNSSLLILSPLCALRSNLRQVMAPGSGSQEGSENDSNAFKFQKLSGENYSLWAENVEITL